MADDDFDFGFTTYSEQEIKDNLSPKKDDRAERLRDMIMPLLNNLKKDPDKEVIVWPNRVKKIDEFIKKMNKVVDEA